MSFGSFYLLSGEILANNINLETAYNTILQILKEKNI
jgi:hypothetical protein